MKYLVDKKEVSKEKFNELLDNAVDDYIDKEYDNLLDMDYPPVKICGATYNTSRILKELDPQNYACIMDLYKNGENANVSDDLEIKQKTSVNGITFEIIYEEGE